MKTGAFVDKRLLTAQDRYIQAEKQDAELLFEIYNSAFYDDSVGVYIFRLEQ